MSAVTKLPGNDTGPSPQELLVACTEQVARQRHQLEVLRSRVHSLRSSAAEVAKRVDEDDAKQRAAREVIVTRAKDEIAAFNADADRLTSSVTRGEVAVGKLRDVLQARQEVVSELRKKVEQAKGALHAAQREEGEKMFESPLACQAALLRQALAQWDAPQGTRRICSESFARADRNHDSGLEWANGEVRAFVRVVFRECAINVPRWSDLTWYNIYRHFDVDSSMALELEESAQFVRFCFEVALRSIDPVGAIREACQFRPLPISPEKLGPAKLARALLADWDLEPEKMQEVCKEAFVEADVNRDGKLEWNNQELRNFVKILFRRVEIPLPPWTEQQWYDLYRRVDVDRDRAIDAEEAAAFGRKCIEELLLEAAAPGSTP